jgi:4-diphosphocytidyl-2-C-methyl-D-erythritol kinase
MAQLEVQARAKLNLTLDVLGRRADGYHELRMVMQSVELCDTLRLATDTGDGVRVGTNLAYLPADGDNLAAKAARALAAAGVGADWGRGLEIRIAKTIPVCAGLAGGSSDAAAVLRGLNELLGLHLPPARLAEIGASVGSDVPYCVLGCTALAEGRGEILTPLPALPPCEVVVCKPAFSISTPELFAQIDRVRIRCRPDTAGVLSALEAGDLPGVARRMYNVFEDVLPPRQRGEIDAIKNTLIQHGALGACMSGSGPTVFGLFDDPAAARAAWAELSGRYRECFLTRTAG